MKLIIPHIGKLQELDARLVRLAEFLGLTCDTFDLAGDADHVARLEQTAPDRCSCFVVNPRVMREWLGHKGLPAHLVTVLRLRFRHLLVHGLRVNAFDSALVAALSAGKLQSVDAIGNGSATYVIAKEARDICESFAGLSFGPVNPVNDHVFTYDDNDDIVRKLISIGGRPFMAALRLEETEALFLAGEDVADLTTEVGDAPLAEYFSRFVPHIMALRYMAGEECWRPCKTYASIIIDDPLLRKSYGFLNFGTLLSLAKRYNFHATIAFIPRNFRRSSSRITRMFRENAARLSICFHGNDHTGGELASTDVVQLKNMLRIAEHRMQLHHASTGLFCDRVMVFPQGRFSIEAMKALKACDFSAAVNTVSHPVQDPARLTIGELAQPAVSRYGGFPLFLRRPIARAESHDIAFNAFFGKPILIVEHHDLFQRTESLVEVATRINAVVPEVHWSNLANIVSNSILTRRTPDGAHHVRAYSATTQISNPSGAIRRFAIEWFGCDEVTVEQVLLNGTPCPEVQVEGAAIRLSVELAPNASQTFRLAHRNERAVARSLGFRWNAHAFLRRRLSEVRDNYLSKNRHLLTAAKGLQRLIR